jgi:hypothetical protein
MYTHNTQQQWQYQLISIIMQATKLWIVPAGQTLAVAG